MRNRMNPKFANIVSEIGFPFQILETDDWAAVIAGPINRKNKLGKMH